MTKTDLEMRKEAAARFRLMGANWELGYDFQKNDILWYCIDNCTLTRKIPPDVREIIEAYQQKHDILIYYAIKNGDKLSLLYVERDDKYWFSEVEKALLKRPTAYIKDLKEDGRSCRRTIYLDLQYGFVLTRTA